MPGGMLEAMLLFREDGISGIRITGTANRLAEIKVARMLAA